MSNFINYDQYATECREIATKMPSGEQKSQILTIAAAWESLAKDAEKRTSGRLKSRRTDMDKSTGN